MTEKLYTLTQHEKRLGLSYWRLRKACIAQQKHGGSAGIEHYFINGRYLCTIDQVDAFLARYKSGPSRTFNGNLNMRTARKEKGLTQEQLAGLVKVKPITILRIENGKTRWPNSQVAFDIAYHLDACVLELLGKDRSE